MDRDSKGVRLYGKQVREWSSPPPASPGIFYSSYEFPASENDGDDGASIHSHSSTGYHSGVHSNAGFQSGIHSSTGSGITLASSSHTTPTHNIHNQPHYGHHSQLGDALFSPSYVHHRQDYPTYPVGISSTAITTSNNSQYEYNSPKVGCPMAKVAPYSAQVNNTPVTLLSPRRVSTGSASYQELAHRNASSNELILQQLKTPSSDGSMNSMEPTGSKWNGLIELKDRIMIQKDQLVERQKHTINRLQQECREYEARLKQLLLNRSLEEAGVIGIRLQELEYENASLSAQLSEQVTAKSSEVEALTYKLASVECELEKVIKECAETSEDLNNTISSLRSELSDKSSLFTQREEELAVSREENKRLLGQVEKLRHHLGNMPSPEEYLSLKNGLSTSQSNSDRLSKMLLSKDDELQSVSEQLKEKKEAVKRLDKEVSVMKVTIAQLESALNSTKERNTKLHSQQLSSDEELISLRQRLSEAEQKCKQELQAMRERHRLKFNDSTSKLRSQCKALAKRVLVLETQLTKNSDAMMSLNDELKSSQGTIVGLKSSMKELVSHNQDLMQANLNSQDINDMSRAASRLSEADEDVQFLMAELCQCLIDFESIVSLTTSVMDGKCSYHPPHASVSSHTLRESLSSPAAWRDKLSLVKKEIERLRATVSEYLAEEVVNSCNLQ